MRLGRVKALAVAGLVFAPGIASLIVWAPRATPTFTMSGGVNGLVPGVSSQLNVVVSNPSDVELNVTSIRVTSQDAGPGCVSIYLFTEDFEGSIVVEAHSSTSVTLPVELSADAPTACRRQVFPLSFVGRADRT